MKNAIKYFYNLDVDSIRQVKDKYFLNINNTDYYLENIDNKDINIEEKYNLTKNNPLFHEIKKNISNNLITNINNHNYILMKLNTNIRSINIYDIYNLNNLYIYVDKINPITRSIELWSRKIDYLEYQMSQVSKKYPLIRESFSYFNGLTETAISLLKTIENNMINTYLSHSRIRYNDTTVELYNPLNIIIDSKVRDICEYYKDAFFNNQYIYDDIVNYLSYLDNNEKIYFMSRMLYPSYYFDKYEKIIIDELEEKEILNIIAKVNEYEILLKKIYSDINVNSIINIEWLK